MGNSIDVEGRNILLFWKLRHSSTRYTIVYYTPICTGISCTWTGQGSILRRILTQVLLQLLIMKLPHMVFPAWEAVWWLWGWEQQWQWGERDKCDLEVGINFAKASALYVTVKSLAYSTIRYDKQNSLNLEPALFHLKWQCFKLNSYQISLEMKLFACKR